MNRKPLAAIAFLAATAIALTGCSSGGTVMGVKLVKKNTLTVCTNPPFKPMEFTDANGAVVGFDMDVMNLVGAKMGIPVKFVETDFPQITSGAAMAAKKCDLAASSITITDKRKEAVTFSAPYFAATQALAAKSDSGIKGLADLKGKALAVQSDTTGAKYAEDNAAANGYTVTYFDDGGAALTAILSGKVAATLIDLPIVADFVRENPGTAMVTQFDTGELYGFAIPKGDNGDKLAKIVNDVVAAAQTDGTYLKIYQKWIDPTATSVPTPGQ